MCPGPESGCRCPGSGCRCPGSGCPCLSRCLSLSRCRVCREAPRFCGRHRHCHRPGSQPPRGNRWSRTDRRFPRCYPAALPDCWFPLPVCPQQQAFPPRFQRWWHCPPEPRFRTARCPPPPEQGSPRPLPPGPSWAKKRRTDPGKESAPKAWRFLSSVCPHKGGRHNLSKKQFS